MTELEDRWRDLGEFIRDQRRIGQLSLRKLSEMAGISNPYLSQIERGLRKPSAEILRQIAQALHISAESLYVRAGILEERDGVVDLVAEIRRDAVLNDEQKKTLVLIYESFRAEQQAVIDAQLEALDLSDEALAAIAGAGDEPAGDVLDDRREPAAGAPATDGPGTDAPGTDTPETGTPETGTRGSDTLGSDGADLGASRSSDGPDPEATTAASALLEGPPDDPERGPDTESEPEPGVRDAADPVNGDARAHPPGAVSTVLSAAAAPAGDDGPPGDGDGDGAR
jgi:transcriptional regulator with XRE-family HTH domain